MAFIVFGRQDPRCRPYKEQQRVRHTQNCTIIVQKHLCQIQAECSHIKVETPPKVTENDLAMTLWDYLVIGNQLDVVVDKQKKGAKEGQHQEERT